MAVKFDPILNKLRLKDTIPEVESDPSHPSLQDAWVLKTGGTHVGNPIGLLLMLTYTEPTNGTYQLSYKTLGGAIVRATLS